MINLLSANPTDKLPTNCLSVFDHFVGLVLKGLSEFKITTYLQVSQVLRSLNIMKSGKIIYISLDPINLVRKWALSKLHHATLKNSST